MLILKYILPTGSPMKKVEQVEVEYVRKTTAMLIAVICLAAGFVVGVLYTNLDSDKEKSSIVRNIPSPPVNNSTTTTTTSTTQQINNMSLIRQLEKTVAADPGNTDALAQLGHAYFDSNQYTRAIEAYQKYLELKPDDADIWTDLGVMYRRRGEPVEALRAFDKAIEVNPGHQQARFNKGVVLLSDQKDRNAAVKIWQELVEINPSAKTPGGRLIRELINELTSESGN